MSNGFGYIERAYNVRFARGQRVTIDGRPGKITSANGAYINVPFDGMKKPIPCHPTWRVEVLQ